MQKILITGASGFIGANICRFFYQLGYEVFALTGPNNHNWRIDDLQINKKFIDITSINDVQKYISEVQPNIIVNCAAYGAYSNQDNIDKIYKVNVGGLKNLLESSIDLKSLNCFIQLGSSSEYGTNCSGPNEFDNLMPDSHYAISKISANYLINFYSNKYKIKAFNLRLYSVYGPYEEISRLIPKLLIEVYNKKLPPLVNKNISRDFIYIDDVCRAILELSNIASQLTGGMAFNIGSNTCTTLENLINVVIDNFDINVKPNWGSMENRVWDHSYWFSNSNLAKQVFGWEAKIQLLEGLKKTYQWMIDNDDIVEKAKQYTVL